MRLTIRQAILNALEKGPMGKEDLWKKVSHQRWRLDLWDNFQLKKKFPEELKRLQEHGRIFYATNACKYLLVKKKYLKKRKF